ncbi:hypothetical protein KIPB_007646 [Kipferlia bialata]|uniref:Coatomer alpha subunit C-terminal domain-containing protein n=1 Tax=Kipferlia bialata TaxID=797122 RepID=A0A9K3CYV4_9EUKA|nr:hypothetical protein KIPB_007646 [Kipferlia bialata]|eukprot:g7646.t1
MQTAMLTGRVERRLEVLMQTRQYALAYVLCRQTQGLESEADSLFAKLPTGYVYRGTEYEALAEFHARRAAYIASQTPKEEGEGEGETEAAEPLEFSAEEIDSFYAIPEIKRPTAVKVSESVSGAQSRSFDWPSAPVAKALFDGSVSAADLAKVVEQQRERERLAAAEGQADKDGEWSAGLEDLSDLDEGVTPEGIRSGALGDDLDLEAEAEGDGWGDDSLDMDDLDLGDLDDEPQAPREVRGKPTLGYRVPAKGEDPLHAVLHSEKVVSRPCCTAMFGCTPTQGTEAQELTLSSLASRYGPAVGRAGPNDEHGTLKKVLTHHGVAGCVYIPGLLPSLPPIPVLIAKGESEEKEPVPLVTLDSVSAKLTTALSLFGKGKLNPSLALFRDIMACIAVAMDDTVSRQEAAIYQESLEKCRVYTLALQTELMRKSVETDPAQKTRALLLSLLFAHLPLDVEHSCIGLRRAAVHAYKAGAFSVASVVATRYVELSSAGDTQKMKTLALAAKKKGQDLVDVGFDAKYPPIIHPRTLTALDPGMASERCSFCQAQYTRDDRGDVCALCGIGIVK